MMQIGQTLKLLRVAADLKQTELAKDLGVTANYLSLVEKGHREPSLTFLKKFAKQLNVPLGYFLWLALADDKSEDAGELQESMDKLLEQLVRGYQNGHVVRGYQNGHAKATAER
jgi:transcriptional regulator with XRE-family HTH domain